MTIHSSRWDNNRRLWYVDVNSVTWLTSTGHHLSQFSSFFPSGYTLPPAAASTTSSPSSNLPMTWQTIPTAPVTNGTPLHPAAFPTVLPPLIPGSTINTSFPSPPASTVTPSQWPTTPTVPHGITLSNSKREIHSPITPSSVLASPPTQPRSNPAVEPHSSTMESPHSSSTTRGATTLIATPMLSSSFGSDDKYSGEASLITSDLNIATSPAQKYTSIDLDAFQSPDEIKQHIAALETKLQELRDRRPPQTLTMQPPLKKLKRVVPDSSDDDEDDDDNTSIDLSGIDVNPRGGPLTTMLCQVSKSGDCKDFAKKQCEKCNAKVCNFHAMGCRSANCELKTLCFNCRLHKHHK
jgi:hypothetical protein